MKSITDFSYEGLIPRPILNMQVFEDILCFNEDNLENVGHPRQLRSHIELPENNPNNPRNLWRQAKLALTLELVRVLNYQGYDVQFYDEFKLTLSKPYNPVRVKLNAEPLLPFTSVTIAAINNMYKQESKKAHQHD